MSEINAEVDLKMLESVDVHEDALLQALSLLVKNDWEGAHEIVQGMEGVYPAWIHALVHRMEGDISNARYWYYQANQKIDQSLNYLEEVRIILKHYLSHKKDI